MGSPLLALMAAACFGAALVVTQFGFRYAAPITGATVSITFTLIAWLALSPLLLDLSALHAGALALFGLVGLFYPAVVTLLTYESNRQLGPTLTGAVSCTAPLFAVLAAVLFLGERVSWGVSAGGAIVVGGLMLLTTRAPLRTAPGWRLLLPLSGALLRGIAQMLTKLALILWPSPFAAAFVGYATSTVLMWGVTAATSGAPRKRLSAKAVACFMGVGALNGGAVLLTYHALNTGTVAVVSPIVATYPLFTMIFSAWFLKTESLGGRAIAGVLLAIAGVALIVIARSA
jgi:drug/metabolite transporter (DMT)-like permease